MKVRTTVIVSAVAAAVGLILAFGADASEIALSLAEKVAQADAIVVGKVAEVEPRRYALTLFERGSDGKKPELTTFYNLAVLHPETVIKADTDTMVNKADRSNPIAWMHMAYPTPGQQSIWHDSWRPTAGKGEYRIWFLRRDLIFTGHYFIRQAEDVTEARIQEIKRLVGEKHEQKPQEGD